MCVFRCDRAGAGDQLVQLALDASPPVRKAEIPEERVCATRQPARRLISGPAALPVTKRVQNLFEIDLIFRRMQLPLTRGLARETRRQRPLSTLKVSDRKLLGAGADASGA